MKNQTKLLTLAMLACFCVSTTVLAQDGATPPPATDTGISAGSPPPALETPPTVGKHKKKKHKKHRRHKRPHKRKHHR